MPDPKPRKKAAPKKNPAQKRAAKAAARKPLTHTEAPQVTSAPPPPRREPVREIPAENRIPLPDPEPASEEQLLVACSQLDPLSQEVMIAARLAAMPSQRDGGMPVNIPRMVRPGWARNLRKLGIFCIPELATHELVAPDGTGVMVNHTASTMRRITESDIWAKAKEMRPELAELVDNAQTPEERQAAMKILAEKMPPEMRATIRRIRETKPEDLEPR